MVRRKSTGRKRKLSKQKQGTKVMNTSILQKIKILQMTTHLLIPKIVFARVVREVLCDLSPQHDSFRLQATALEALQEAAEMYLVQFFEDSTLLCLHGKRVTLMQKDMNLLRRLRGRNDIINR